MRRLLTVAAFMLSVPFSPAAGQSVQYRTSTGLEFRAEPDTGPVRRATEALAAAPRNIDRIIALGLAQAGARQYREAIWTFSSGLAFAPNDARLLRWRGHRYLTVREFDLALVDLTRGAKIDSTMYGIWYHLGVVRFARGEFAAAAAAFARAQPIAPDAGELAGSTDWRWMSLARAGRRAEGDAMLATRPDSLRATNAYSQRLRMYRGETPATELITPADTAEIQVATLQFGLGNWYLVQGDTARAREAFTQALRPGGWPSFGYIVAERELARLGARSAAPRR